MCITISPLGEAGRVLLGSTRPGEGDFAKALFRAVLDLRGAVARLAQIGYRGYLSVEYEGMENPWQAVKRGVIYCQSPLRDK